MASNEQLIGYDYNIEYDQIKKNINPKLEKNSKKSINIFLYNFQYYLVQSILQNIHI